MKTMAIEFTLTYAGLARQGLPLATEFPTGEGPPELRCRVTLDGLGDVQVFWREHNLLNEETWRGGHHDSGPAPLIAGHYMGKAGILLHAMRLMAESLDPQLRSEAKELPNGAIVFDLGTV